MLLAQQSKLFRKKDTLFWNEQWREVCKWNQSPLYLPCEIWGLKFCLVYKSFIRAKFYLCRLHINFCTLQRCIFCIFSWKYFLVSVQNISKNANYEEFLAKFVNTNNHTHIFLHGVIILQGAKNFSQHAKIFEAWQKINFLQGR